MSKTKTDPGDSIVKSRPCSLIGAAGYVREWYIRKGIMTDQQTLILVDRKTGEIDVAKPERDEDRIKRRLEKARTGAQKKRIAKSKRAQREARRKRESRKRKNITDPPILENI
jgi:hypothetical protein